MKKLPKSLVGKYFTTDKYEQAQNYYLGVTFLRPSRLAQGIRKHLRAPALPMLIQYYYGDGAALPTDLQNLFLIEGR